MSSSCRIPEPFVLDANAMFEESLAQNTWKSYENGLKSFNEFRSMHNMSPISPPPVWHIANFIAYLANKSYSPSTAKLYVAALGFVLKCKDIKDTTQSFIIKQMLKGMTRLYGVPDVRLSISIEMIKKIPKALSHTCSSKYEAVMFTVAFYLAFSALLRVGEFTCSNSSEVQKIMKVSDPHISNIDQTLILKLKYPKTDQMGRSSV